MHDMIPIDLLVYINGANRESSSVWSSAPPTANYWQMDRFWCLTFTAAVWQQKKVVITENSAVSKMNLSKLIVCCGNYMNENTKERVRSNGEPLCVCHVPPPQVYLKSSSLFCPQPTLQSCLPSAPPPTTSSFFFSLDDCIVSQSEISGKKMLDYHCYQSSS